MNNSFLEYHIEPVTLHSGGRSHYRIDARKMFLDAALRELVLDWMVEQIPYNPKTDIIGVPTGGTWWAQALAEKRASIQYIDIPIDLSDDLRQRIAPREGGQLIVVDDVLTTGASVIAFGQATKRLAVVDRSERGLRTVECWARLPLPLVGEKAND